MVGVFRPGSAASFGLDGVGRAVTSTIDAGGVGDRGDVAGLW